MTRWISRTLLCGVVFASACSKRERSAEDEAEWADIQPLTNVSAVVDAPPTNLSRRIVQSEGEDYAPLIQRLEEMETIVRAVGETEITGESLVLDYERHVIWMDRDVVVTDDRGTLDTDRLEGRFSVSNEVEYIEAQGHVRLMVRHPEGEALLTGGQLVLNRERRTIQMEKDVVVVDARGKLRTDRLTGYFSVSNEVQTIEARGHVRMDSDGRTAVAENADYNYQTGFVQLEGRASASDGANRLSGERIQLWVLGDRRMVCEPNAVLHITGGTSGLPFGEESDGTTMDTEIRANRVVYDQSKALAEFDGNVRVRDPRVAMNCGSVRLYLKEGNEIDWIEAQSEVIIQLEDRKALADRASYYADEGRFVLDGDPKVKQGRNIMTGDRITFWQETRRMVCEPNARVLLYPDEEMKAKFLKDLKD